MKTELFSIRGHLFTSQHFLEILHHFNLLEEWQQRLLRAKAIEASAQKSGKAYDRELISQWSQDFRYEKDLLNIEELDSWLLKAGLEKADLESFLIRRFWGEQEDIEAKNEVPAFEERELFSEIILSGEYLSLLASWQKRLLSWFEKNDKIYKSLDELEENFQAYEKALNENCHLELWLRAYKQDLMVFEIEFFEGPDEEFESAQIDFVFKGYYKDLPEEVQRILKYQQELSVEGPFISEGKVYKWQKLILRIDADLTSDEAQDYAFEKYQDEVWKTLSVKYLDSSGS